MNVALRNFLASLRLVEQRQVIIDATAWGEASPSKAVITNHDT